MNDPVPDSLYSVDVFYYSVFCRKHFDYKFDRITMGRAVLCSLHYFSTDYFMCYG